MGQLCSRRRVQSNDRRTHGNAKKNQHANKLAVAPTEEQTADIFKLDIDCFEEVFDYLPRKDLVRVGKVCKRLQQVAGYCFQQNYLGEAVWNNFKYDNNVNHFAPFIHKIEIFPDSFKQFIDEQSKFKRLKQIEFNGMKLDNVVHLNKIAKDKLEVLSIRHGYLGNIPGFIDGYTNLKRLEISCCEGELDWLNQKRPTLEYFEFYPCRTLEHIYMKSYLKSQDSEKSIPMFLELNPNIRKFATSADWLWENRDVMMASNIKLDSLAISIYEHHTSDESMINLLNKLYMRGFYKKLHLFTISIDQKIIDQLIKLNLNGLVQIWVKWINEIPLKFSALNNLEDLCLLGFYKGVADWEIMANNLVNFKRIILCRASIDDIMPFIKRSVQMQKIRIDYVGAGAHFNEETKVIDLLALNREREKLPEAQKITLYVKEEVYLATKWAMKETDCGLIRLKRKDSCEWDCVNLRHY